MYQHVHPFLQLLMREMDTVLKNQMFEVILSLDSTVEAIHFLKQFRAVFQIPHFTDTCATVYD